MEELGARGYNLGVQLHFHHIGHSSKGSAFGFVTGPAQVIEFTTYQSFGEMVSISVLAPELELLVHWQYTYICIIFRRSLPTRDTYYRRASSNVCTLS